MVWVRFFPFLSLAWLAVGVTAAGAQEFYQALALTYQTNPTLLAARAELRAVNEGVPQALSNYRPFVSLDGEAGVQEIDQNRGRWFGDHLSLRGQYRPVPTALSRRANGTADVARAEAEVQAQRANLRSVEQSRAARRQSSPIWTSGAIEDVLRLNINNERVLTRQLEATAGSFRCGRAHPHRRGPVGSAPGARDGGPHRRRGRPDLGSQAVFKEVIGIAARSRSRRPARVLGLPDDEAGRPRHGVPGRTIPDSHRPRCSPNRPP